MKARAKTSQQIPLQIVGGTAFGRYPKISVEQTFNAFQADDGLVPFAGYKFQEQLGVVGRGLFVSDRSNKMFAVADDRLLMIDTNLGYVQVGSLLTISGDVYMAEDLQHNIGICDGLKIYVYNYATPNFSQAYTDAPINGLNFVPTHISMQDGRFIATDTANSQWRLSDPSSGNLNFPSAASVSPPGAAFTGSFQSKPDAPIATVPFPARGNTLLVVGSNHAEPWFDIGAQLFPYQKNTSYNIDYGAINASTIAWLDNLVAYVGINEKTGPVIIFSNGQDAKQISNDGINYKLATLVNPEACYGFLFRQDGHLFYVATFYDVKDNFSIAFDFTTNKFYTLTDEFMNYFIAKDVVFFNNTYYFISINDGNLYELNSAYTSYQYQNRNEEIPRVRVCKTFRTPDGTPFIVNSVAFPLEQGIDDQIFQDVLPASPIGLATENSNGIAEEDTAYALSEEITEQLVNTYQPAVDMAISIDGGETFGNFARIDMNPLGFRKNRFVYYGLGYCNEITCQFRFFGLQRFVALNGIMNVYG